MVRHGETEWNREQRLQGQLDSPLTQTGIEQIRTLANELSCSHNPSSITQIVSSPLNRANHSAEILQQTFIKPLTLHKPMQERSFGIWQGRLFDDIQTDGNFSEVFFNVNNTPIPQGESAIEARHRMTQGLTQLSQQFPNQKLLIVTHGELLRCFLSGLENSIDGSAYQLFKNGKVFEVHYSPSRQHFKFIQP